MRLTRDECRLVSEQVHLPAARLSTAHLQLRVRSLLEGIHEIGCEMAAAFDAEEREALASERRSYRRRLATAQRHLAARGA